MLIPVVRFRIDFAQHAYLGPAITRRLSPLRIGALTLSALLAATPSPAKAQETAAACQEPGWDMSRELAAFRGAPLSARAGAGRTDVPAIELGRLYALQLRPQTAVQFLQPPERASRVQSPVAGLAEFRSTLGGKYRITVDAPLWIDVVAPAGIVQPTGFNGWHSCDLFRKSVEYSLQAGQSLVLQLSGGASEVVKVVIEPL